MKIKEKVDEIIKRMPKDLSEIEIMRYLYLEMGKIVRRDVKFFYGTDEEKEKIYHKDITLEEMDNNEIMCKHYVNVILLYAFEKVGIKAESVNKETKSPFPHIDIIVTTRDNKRYYLNPIYDLEKIQMGLKTKCFGTLTNKYQNIDLIPEEEIRRIDEKLGYCEHHMYMDEVMSRIREEMLNKKTVRNYIKKENPEIQFKNLDRKKLQEYELDFLGNELSEIRNVTGYIELKQYYKDILNRVLNKTEKKNITYHDCLYGNKLNGDKMKLCIELKKKEESVYYLFSNKESGYEKLTEEMWQEEKKKMHIIKPKQTIEEQTGIEPEEEKER